MKTIALSFSFLFIVMAASAQNFNDLKKKAEKKITLPSTPKGFTEEEAGKALKEALSKGAVNGSATVSKLEGYFGIQKLKFHFLQMPRRLKINCAVLV